MVFEKVCKILADQFGVAENSLNMDTAFIEDLGADSLDLYQIILGVEDAFDIEIPQEEAEKICKQNAMKMISKKGLF